MNPNADVVLGVECALPADFQPFPCTQITQTPVPVHAGRQLRLVAGGSASDMMNHLRWALPLRTRY
jgi:hypothetical protein